MILKHLLRTHITRVNYTLHNNCILIQLKIKTTRATKGDFKSPI